MSTSHTEPRLALVDPDTADPAIREAFAKLPVINVFRALANATSLYPAFTDLLALLFKPVLEIEPTLVRMIVLRVAKLQDCAYVWRQNVIVARSVGVEDRQIAALERGETTSACFSDAQQAAFAFVDEVVQLVEVTDATYTRARQAFPTARSPRCSTWSDSTCSSRGSCGQVAFPWTRCRRRRRRSPALRRASQGDRHECTRRHQAEAT